MTWRVDRHMGWILGESNGRSSVIIAKAPFAFEGERMHDFSKPHATRDAALANLDRAVAAVNAQDALVASLRECVALVAERFQTAETDAMVDRAVAALKGARP